MTLQLRVEIPRTNIHSLRQNTLSPSTLLSRTDTCACVCFRGHYFFRRSRRPSVTLAVNLGCRHSRDLQSFGPPLWVGTESANVVKSTRKRRSRRSTHWTVQTRSCRGATRGVEDARSSDFRSRWKRSLGSLLLYSEETPPQAKRVK